MRFTLRTLILVPVVLAAVVVATNTAQAEVTIKVPFTFTVYGKTCPAGEYSVNHDSSRGTVTLSSKDGAKHFNWHLGPGDGNSADARVTLRFEESGQSHVLKSVQYGPMTTARLDKKIRESDYSPTQLARGR